MISLIIPAFNNLHDVLRCVKTLVDSAGADIQLIVQDDCSPDVNFTEWLPAGVVERNEENAGFAFNCNAGARRAQGDILAFCNQDVQALPIWSWAWAKELERTFEDETVAVVGARLLFPDYRIQSAGGIFDGRCQPIHRCLGYTNPHYAEVNTPMDVSWVTGAFLGIRRDIFWKVGGFSLEYAPSYFEDVDICCRVQELGYRVRYEPSITFQHRPGSTGGSPYFLNSALTFKKNWVDTGKLTPDVSTVYTRYW